MISLTPRILPVLAATVALAVAALPVRAESTPQAALAAVLGAYTDLAPVPGPFGLGEDEAAEVQRMVVLNLRPRWGEVVGYKAALTSPAARERFGVRAPVSGVLLENMFTGTGATVARGNSVRPVLEADLLVRVGDERINEATTAAAVLASLSEAIPYLEIPDLMFADLAGLAGTDIVAINAGARLGVAGEPVKLAGLGDAAARLAAFTVSLVDGEGNALGGGTGAALMGHPLEAALWLKNDLARRGIRLEPGNLLSLGSLGAPVALDGLSRVTATYEGLVERPLKIHVGFR